MTAPTNGSTVAGQLTVSAAASDPVGVATVQFEVTNFATSTTSNVGSAVVSAPYQATWDTTSVANGEYALTAIATDEAGRTATAAAVDVAVSNPRPERRDDCADDRSVDSGSHRGLEQREGDEFAGVLPARQHRHLRRFSMDSASYEGTITTVKSVTTTGLPVTWHRLGESNNYSSQAGGFLEVWWTFNPSAQTNVAATATFGVATKNVSPPVGDFQILVMDNAAPDQSSAAWAAKQLAQLPEQRSLCRGDDDGGQLRLSGYSTTGTTSRRLCPAGAVDRMDRSQHA